MRGVRAACIGVLLGLSGVVCGVSLAGTLVAAEEGRYSLGTIQVERSLQVPAGEAGTTTIGFYNIDGNVPTTVELRVAETPSWCDITLEHAGARAGALTLLVEPSTPQSEMPRCDAEGRQAFLLEPRGYVCADVVGVHVEITSSMGEDDTGVVRLVALARWNSGGGLALPPQEREFLFDVVVDAGDGTAMVQPSRPDTDVWAIVVAALVLAGAVPLYRVLAKSG